MKLAGKIVLLCCILSCFLLTVPSNTLAQQENKYVNPYPVFTQKLLRENLVLTRAMCNICCERTKPSDKLQLMILGDLACNENTVIPGGSIIEGKVTRVQKCGKFRSDACIFFLITNIRMNSEDISLENNPVQARIVNINYKCQLRRIIQRSPVVIGGFATSLTLLAASSLSSGAISAISLGAGILGGAISGIVDPDVTSTRFESALVRGIEGTPAGSFLITVENGSSIDTTCYPYLTIKLDGKTRKEIADSMEKALASNKKQ